MYTRHCSLHFKEIRGAPTRRTYREIISTIHGTTVQNILVSGDCGLAVSTQNYGRFPQQMTLLMTQMLSLKMGYPQDVLVEYKNPHACTNSLIEEAITNMQIESLTWNNGTVTLKRSSLSLKN